MLNSTEYRKLWVINAQPARRVGFDMDKKALSERDICTKFITPALVQAGWDFAFVFALSLNASLYFAMKNTPNRWMSVQLVGCSSLCGVFAFDKESMTDNTTVRRTGLCRLWMQWSL